MRDFSAKRLLRNRDNPAMTIPRFTRLPAGSRRLSSVTTRASRILTASLICAATAATAQTSTQPNGNSTKENDPYSRYGIGEPITGTNVLNRGMGYLSTAYQNATAINTENPASYASLKRTTYEAGFTGSARTLKFDGTSVSTGSASFAYLRMGIPLGKNAGMALGLQPQTRVFYNAVDSNIIPGLGRSASIYNGEGGLNYAFIGGAGSIGGFSFGANFGYMFGNIRNSSRLVNADTSHVLNSDFSSITRYGGLYYKLGVQYHDSLSNGIHLRLGATATLGQNINGSRESYSSTYQIISGLEMLDTAYGGAGISGKLRIPATYSIGAQLGGSNWSLGVDAYRTDWKDYSNYEVRDTFLKDQSYRFNVGGEYTPDPMSVYSYFSRVTYRLGVYYGTDYVNLRNTDLNYYGVTIGASFPFKNSLDRLHTALEFGRRGSESNGLVAMNYLRLHLGISLNDRWFIKRRYD
jgi:hypothetical protein